MSDPVTLTGEGGTPYLAVDVQPDIITGAFVLDDSELDGPDLLSWGTDLDEWVNVVCDVLSVDGERGATRDQGPLTRTEAGTVTVILSDADRSFDPMVNRYAVRSGTPLRLRAWGYADVAHWTEERRNLATNPTALDDVAGWYGLAGGGAVALTRTTGLPATGLPPAVTTALRVTWSTAATAHGGAVAFGQTPIYDDPLNPTGVVAWDAIPCGTFGVPLAVGMYGRTSIGQRLRLAVRYWDQMAQPLVTVQYGVEQQHAANTWQRHTALLTPPAGAVWCQVRLESVAGTGAALWPVGAWLEGTAVQAGQDPGTVAVGAYFDGNTPDQGSGGGALAYEWVAGTDQRGVSVESYATVTFDRWDAPLFTGEVDELTVAYQHEDPPLVTMTVVDLVAALARYESEGYPDPGVGSGENLRTRTNRVLTDVGRGVLADSDPGSAYAAVLPATTFTRDAWAEISAATDAELGRVWVDVDNRLVVRSRGSELSGEVRGTLSDVHGAAPHGVHCCMADPLVAFGGHLLNRVIAKRQPAPGELNPNPATVRRDDAYSQALHGTQSLTAGSLELSTDGQVAAWAEYLITTRTMPDLRVDSVRPAPSVDDPESARQAWPAVCATDIGDRWAFQFHPGIGPDVDRAVAVLGIRFRLTPDEWVVTWTTVDAPLPDALNPTGWFLLDTSALDGPDLLAPYGYLYDL